LLGFAAEKPGTAFWTKTALVMTNHFALRLVISRRTFRDLESFRQHVEDRSVWTTGCLLTIAAMTIERYDRLGGTFVTDRAAGASTGKTRGHKCGLVNVEIVSGNDVSFVILMHFFQQLLFAASFSAFVRARLVATRVSAMVKDQQSGLRFTRDFGKLF